MLVVAEREWVFQLKLNEMAHDHRAEEAVRPDYNGSGFSVGTCDGTTVTRDAALMRGLREILRLLLSLCYKARFSARSQCYKLLCAFENDKYESKRNARQSLRT